MTYDPFAAAMNPPERKQTSRWFGQMFAEVWPCVLVKGSGKILFDANMHKKSDRLTVIDMDVVPLSDYDVNFVLTRGMIAEFGGWPKITLPSIKALNVDLRSLHKSWVAVEFKPTGRTYQKDGETKHETTFVLVGTFADEAACRAAYAEFNQIEAGATADDGESWGATVDTDAEKQAAAMFLGPVWASCKGDLTAFQNKLASMAPLNKFFTLQSPEVQTLIAQGAD